MGQVKLLELHKVAVGLGGPEVNPQGCVHGRDQEAKLVVFCCRRIEDGYRARMQRLESNDVTGGLEKQSSSPLDRVRTVLPIEKQVHF